MSEWKFRMHYRGSKEIIITFRANEKLDAFATIRDIASRFDDAKYEMIEDNEE